MADRVVVEQEMALTHADFFRSFPNALNGESYAVEGGTVRVSGPDGSWTIELGPEGKRRIALLAVPATKVRLVFEGYSEAARKSALERFERAFQRGGG
jgi:hypothetical protein